MRKPYLPVLTALAGGAVGSGLRRWQLATGFERETGLAIPGNIPAAALVVLTALMAAALLLLARKGAEELPFDTAFDARGDQIYMTCAVLAAFLMLGSAAAEGMALPAARADMAAAQASGAMMPMASALPPLRVAGGVLGAGCILALGRNNYRGLGKGKENLSLLGLCLVYGIWLISLYQDKVSDPVVQSYVYQVLTVVVSIMAFYYLAGWSFQKPVPRRTAFFCLMAVYLSPVALADIPSLADCLRLGAGLLFFASQMVILLKEHPAGEVPAEREVKDHG